MTDRYPTCTTLGLTLAVKISKLGQKPTCDKPPQVSHPVDLVRK